jgi:two-component system sensor histidine kinase PhoQ
MLSLNARLLLAASLVLAAFLGITGFTLDRAFYDSTERALRERLQAQLYTLLAVTDVDYNTGLTLPDALPDARYSRPGSGLYAQVISNDASQLWRSPSLLGQSIGFDMRLDHGVQHFDRVQSGGVTLYVLSYGVSWENADGPLAYTFVTAEDLSAFSAQIGGFRQSLWGWLGGLALVLLLAQGSILRWSLSPLRRVEADLADIEAGRQESLQGRYPKELHGLTTNLNVLLGTERRQLARYRDGLADLAHSLKTPLAVLRGAIDDRQPDETLRDTLREQTGRMNQIVDYQLQRAATSGRTTLMAPIAVAPLLDRIVATLCKVHNEKHVEAVIRADAALMFHGDEGDMLELCGNLIDNAYKWCRGKVEITAVQQQVDATHAGLSLSIDDDGPGIPPDHAQEVLKRGARADAAVSGHGIGLAVVQEIVTAYAGTLTIGSSPLGGARMVVFLPQR